MSKTELRLRVLMYLVIIGGGVGLYSCGGEKEEEIKIEPTYEVYPARGGSYKSYIIPIRNCEYVIWRSSIVHYEGCLNPSHKQK